MKKLREQLLQLSSPQNMGRLTNQFYQQQIGSPAFSQAQGTIAAGANATSNELARRLGASGISGTGSGALLGSLTPSLVGNHEAGLRSAAYNSALGQANDAVQQQAGALKTGMNPFTGQMMPGQTQQLFAGGLDAFIPYLQKMLSGGAMGQQRQPLVPYGGYGQDWQSMMNSMGPMLYGR